MGAYEQPISSYSYSSSNDKLADEITLLAGQINAAKSLPHDRRECFGYYQFLKLIAEFDRREAWASAGIKSCAHWLNWKCGIAIGAAREKVRVARCLEKLPKINNAFSLGVLSFSKVRAMTRVACNDNEEYLLMIAEHGTASHIEKLVGKFQKVETHQNKDQEEQHNEERKMVSYQDDGGMWHIHAKLPAEAGALVVKAIDAILNEQKLNEQKEQQQEENVSAETCSEETIKEYPFDQKRVDALTMMAEHYLATKTNDEGIKSLSGSERCQVMLHVDIKTLQSQDSDSCCTHKHSNLDNKHWISPQTAKRLSCDASLVTVLEDDRGNVLNIGRRSRTIPPSIYRALSLRDTTCRHPGCCSTNYLDAHHIVHWANGGETSLDNLVMLCRHHHRGLHKGEFHIKVEQSDIVFTATDGKVLERNIILDNPQKNDAIHNLMPFVNKNSAITEWAGETMDYSMAVDGLLKKSGIG